MAEGLDDAEKDERRFVWWSDAKSVRCGTLSVLAVVETLCATVLGAWIWFHWGLYPLLLSSTLMAFLTMLRTPKSVELGAQWFQAYWGNVTGIPPRSRKGIFILVASVAVTFSLSYWIATLWLPGLSGWALFWRAVILGWFAMTIGIAGAAAGAVATAGAVAVAVAVAVAGAVAGAVAVAGVAAGAVVVVVVVVVARAGVYLPGIAVGVFFRAVLTRAVATLWTLPQGILAFAKNWTSLVTSLDVRTGRLYQACLTSPVFELEH